MSLAIDGLISGLDTTSLINQLMAVNAAPQTLLKNKVTGTQTLMSGLQGLNTQVASLATLAKKAALPATTDLFSATSSAASVQVTAAAGAAPGQLEFAVTAVARAQVTVSAAMAVWPDTPPTLTIVDADGVATQITAASSSLSDVASAITASAAGVKAVRVAAGSDPVTGDPIYRLQLTSAQTGADHAFTVYRGSSAQVTAGTATNLLDLPGSASVTSASDAAVTLWGGTSAEQVITSSTNSFADILPGVSLTVSAVEADPVVVSISRDAKATSAIAAGLVASLAAALGFIDARTAVSTSAATGGGSATSAGIFTGNGIVRAARATIMSAASLPIGGRSPSEIGISVTRSGTLEYDEAKFTAALSADPAGTQAMVRTLASRVATAAENVSDKYDGTITNLITGQQSALKSLSDQIGDWDLRLASQRATLERTYSALEVQLSNLQSQSSWLTSQLAGLSTSAS
jgi:flagellar hook-associated protein 2